MISPIEDFDWEAYENGVDTVAEYGDGYCKLYEDEEVLWESWADDEYDGYDLCDDECGFNPYMGCYDYDC